MNANWEVRARLALWRCVVASADILVSKGYHHLILDVANSKVDQNDAAVF